MDHNSVQKWILKVHEDLKLHEFLLFIYKQIGDKAGEGTAYGNLGICYHSLGRCDKAIEHFELHLNIAKQIGDKAAEGRAYCNLGVCYYSLGQYDKAKEHYELDLNIAKQIGDKDGEGKTYCNLGSCYIPLGQYDKAKEHYELHLNIAKQIGDKAGEGNAYGNLGNCYVSLGQYDKAKEYYELHLNIAKQIGDKAGKGMAYGNLGNCYLSLGQYDKTKKHLELHLNIAKQIGDKAREGGAYGNLGNCYHSLGQYDKAKEHYELFLNIAKQIGDKAGEGRAHGNLGNCYDSLGQYDKAKEHCELHLNIAKQIGDKAGEGKAYAYLGNCYLSLGQYDKAKEYHELRLNIAKQIGDKAGEGMAYGNLGNCYFSLGQYVKAKEHHELDLNIAKQIGHKAVEGKAYGALGNYYCALGQYDKGECELRNSVACFQKLFKDAPNEDNSKVSFLETFSTFVSSLNEVLLTQDKTDEALVFAEERRSGALAELMLKRYHLQYTEHKVLDLPQILEMVKAIDSTVLYFTLLPSVICVWVLKPNGEVKFNKHCFKVSPESMEYYVTKNFCSTVRYLTWLINNARQMLRSRCTVKCEDRSLSFLYQEEVTEQIKNEAKPGLAFTASPEGMTALGPGVTRDRPPSPAALQTQEMSTMTLTEKRRQTEYLNEGPLKELYQILLAPVRHLVEGSQVVVVPDGAVPLVPFAALIDENGCYIAESLKVRLVPSLATAKMITEYPQEPEGQASPLIVGDPFVGKFKDNAKVYEPNRLPCAKEEALMIGQLLNVQPLTGEKATRQAVLDKLESANLIHIAAHGDSERGEILLAPSPGVNKENVRKEDVLLTISHLEQKRLRAKLVVLSCCHSGRGEVKTEGVIGVARAFLGAGAHAVLVTLWAVDDNATLFFMREFYQHLARGEKASEALSGAMKATRENDDFCHPYYWAPFVLIGDDVAPLV